MQKDYYAILNVSTMSVLFLIQTNVNIQQHLCHIFEHQLTEKDIGYPPYIWPRREQLLVFLFIVLFVFQNKIILKY